MLFVYATPVLLPSVEQLEILSTVGAVVRSWVGQARQGSSEESRKWDRESNSRRMACSATRIRWLCGRRTGVDFKTKCCGGFRGGGQVMDAQRTSQNGYRESPRLRSAANACEVIELDRDNE